MSNTPIYDELTAYPIKHKDFSVGDFGDWLCHWCGKSGDSWDNPSTISCTIIPYRSLYFVDVIEKMITDGTLTRTRAELLAYVEAEHPLVYEQTVRVLDNANWD